jgi:hypothetical protein
MTAMTKIRPATALAVRGGQEVPPPQDIVDP